MTRSNIIFSTEVHRWSGQAGLTYTPAHKPNSVPANDTSGKISSNHLPVNICTGMQHNTYWCNDHSTWVSVFRVPAATEKQFSSIISSALGFSEATDTHQKIPWKKLCASTKYLCAIAALCPEFVKTCITGWSSKRGNINPHNLVDLSHSFLHMSSSELLIMYYLQSNLARKFACDTSHQITYNCYVIMFLLMEMA